MAGNMLMINVGVNSKDAENSLASLEETLKNISKQDAELKVGENLAAEVENARKKYLDMVKMVNSTEGELQKAFAISGLKQTIADVNALNKKIAETGAKIKPIELQSVMFDGKELFDIKGIDKSLDKFAKKLDKDSNDAFANILTTNLGQKFFSKQKNELEKQLETDLKDLAKDFSQDKLEQYINKYLKIRAIDVAKSGKDKIATSGVTPKAITDLIDNKAISKQLAEGKIDVKAMFQKKATDVGFVKNMKDQIFSELMVFLNQNTDANTFGTKYTDAQMTEMTQGAKESKKQIKLLKEEFIGLINQYNGFNRNSKIELVLDTVARIESLRKELKGLGQDISEINNIEKQDEYKENLNTLKYTLIPDGNDDYYDEDFDTYLLKLKNDFNKLNNTNIQSIMSMNIGDEKKIEKLKENLTQIDELLIKTNSYDSIVPNVSSEVIGDIEILKKQRGQIIAGLKQLNVDVAGVGIPMADYIAGGNKGSGSSGSGNGSGSGNYDSSEVDALKTKLTETQTEAEKLKTALDSANTELEKLKGLSSQSENDNNKITALTAQVNELTQKLTSAEEKKKALESQIASSGGMNNQSGSVQLGEGEQIAKTSDLEAVKELNGAVKSLQERMAKAEKILNDMPECMRGLNELRNQITRMSGNFNEDGSIKNMGKTAEELAKQFNDLEAKFDEKINQKIAEVEKKSYKENQPQRKFKLAESVKSLKIVAEQTTPKVEAQQVNNDIKSAQQDAAVKTEETTKELYKETEEYKTLSKAVQEYNALTSQKLDATAYDARIERMQKMQALVASIIETVEKYEGKASELSELTLKSKNGNIGIQDTVKLDELMSKLKAGEAKNISKKEQTEQLNQDAQKYVDVVRDYNNKFQSIISQKVSSGKQFNSMKQQLNDLSNSIDTIMDKYDQFKGQDFYSAEFASYGEKLRGTVKDSSLDLNEITKFKGYEQEVLSIQLKYSESLQKQKKEQDAVAEAARKKAEAEKEAVKAAEEAENKMSVAEKSREEQKRKALERQAAQSGTQNIVSSDNSADTSPADNATLGAILTEVKSINGKMDKPVETKFDNNTEILSDDGRDELESYKQMSKEDQAEDLEFNYGYDSTQLLKAKISAFSGSFEQLLEILQDNLVKRLQVMTENIQDPNFEYEKSYDGRDIEHAQQLAELIQFLNSSKTTDTQDTTFDSTAIDNILAEVKAISQKMDTSATKASNNASPNISANQSPNNTPSSVTTPSISSEVQAASEAATAEVQAFTTIDDAVTGLTGDINTKTEAIRAEARVMIEASKQETQAIGRIVSGVIKLKEEIKNIPKISVTGKNTKAEPIKITAEISDEQIAKIRQRVLDAFGEKNPIPIFFKPNVQSIKKQINNGLKDGLEKLTIQSFDFENAAKDMKKTLANAMSDVGLQFDTNKLRLDIKTAVNAARDAAENAGRGNPTLTTSGGKNSKGSNIDPKKLDRLYASFEKEVAAYYHKNTLILRDEDVDSMFSSIMRDIKKQSKSKENLDVLYRRFSEAQIAAINKGLDFNADKSDIGTAVINKGYETLISQINKYLETNTKLMGSQFEEEFTKLLSEVSKPAQARTDVDLKQLGAEFARLKNYVDEAGLSGNADNEAKKVSKLDRGYATLALDMKKFHEENNKFDKNTEWADRFNKLFSNITGSISRSEVELEDFRAQFANFKNDIPRDLLGSTVTSEFFENLKGYDIDSIAKIFEKQSGQVKSRLLNDKYGFESPKMTRDISQMLDAQADRLSGLINQENVSDNDIDGIVQHNKQMNNLIDTYQTYSEKRRELQELVSKDSSNEELKRLLQESDALSNSQVYDVRAMKSWSDSYVEAVNNLKTAQSNSEKEQRSSRATSTQQNQYRALTKDIEEATATAQRFKEQYAGLLSDSLNAELNQSISDMSARSGISVDLSNSGEITTWNDESKKLLDTWTAIQERIKSSVVASGQAGEVITATMDYSQYTRKATNALSNLNSKYKDKLTDKQSAEFEQRLEAIRNKVKEISDDTSKYTASNVQVIETDIQQLEKLAKDFEVVQNSENKINSLIRTLSNSKNSIERRGSTAQPVVSSIDNEKAALEELKRQGQNLDIGNPESVRAFVEKLNEADTTVNKLKNDAEQIRISTNATASVAKLDSKFNDLLFKVDKFRRDNSKITSDKGISAQFDSLLRSIQTIEKSDVNFQKLNAQFNQLKATVQGKGLTGRSLGDELKYIAEKIGIKALLGNSIYRVIGAFRQMVGIVTELDTGMTTLRRVTEATEKQYTQFMKNATTSAHELGSAISDVVNATGEFSKLGYNLDEATKLGEAAATYANVGFMDISSSIESMTSVMQGFKLSADEAMSVVDKMDLIGNKFSISSAGIGAALQRSASSLVAAGNDLDEAISLVTAGNTVLQDPESVANGIKIISLRIRSAKSEISELGESTDDMVESSAKLQQKVQAIAGVNIMKDDNTFKSTYQILSEIANKWSELSDIDQANCSPYVQQCA